MPQVSQIALCHKMSNKLQKARELSLSLIKKHSRWVILSLVVSITSMIYGKSLVKNTIQVSVLVTVTVDDDPVKSLSVEARVSQESEVVQC